MSVVTFQAMELVAPWFWVHHHQITQNLSLHCFYVFCSIAPAKRKLWHEIVVIQKGHRILLDVVFWIFCRGILGIPLSKSTPTPIKKKSISISYIPVQCTHIYFDSYKQSRCVSSAHGIAKRKALFHVNHVFSSQSAKHQPRYQTNAHFCF